MCHMCLQLQFNCRWLHYDEENTLWIALNVLCLLRGWLWWVDGDLADFKMIMSQWNDAVVLYLQKKRRRKEHKTNIEIFDINCC